MLAGVELGAPADVDGLVVRAAGLHEDGARSWARGLVRLCVAHSTTLRDQGAFVGARRALELARGMAAATHVPLEVVDVTDRLLELYGRHSFPVARAVLELAAVAQALEATPTIDDVLLLGQLADRAMSAVAMGTRAIDGDVLMAAAAVVDRLVVAAAPIAADPCDVLREVIAASAATCRVTGPLYAGRAARRDGRPDEAGPLEAMAEAALDATGADAPLLRAVVWGTVGRREEALVIADELVAGGVDPAVLAPLWLRLGAPDRAAAALDATAVVDDGGGAWGTAALRAQVLVATGRLAEASAVADAGIDAFEVALARHARDVLKSSATEDLDAADLYLARILADVPAAAAGEAIALRRSFRSRSPPLDRQQRADRRDAQHGPPAPVARPRLDVGRGLRGARRHRRLARRCPRCRRPRPPARRRGCPRRGRGRVAGP